MQCLECSDKQCRKAHKDCNGVKDTVRELYADTDNMKILQSAGVSSQAQLSRIEAVAVFCRARGWNNIGISYCASFEKIARKAADYLIRQGFTLTSCRCTVNGIAGCDMEKSFSPSTACNPIGQAYALNDDASEIIVEMGLCIGHDLLFHKYLKKPFTVLAVKDRATQHNPVAFIEALDIPQRDAPAQ